MKFGEQLTSRLTPEWRTQYLPYEQLKRRIYEILNGAPEVQPGTEDSVTANYFNRAITDYLSTCNEELVRISLFFSMKLAEAKQKYHELEHEMEAFTADEKTDAGQNRSFLGKLTVKDHQKTLNQLKFAYSEFYLSLVLLQNYQQLNGTAFRKLLKKFDKVLQTDRGRNWHSEHVKKSQFVVNKDIDSLLVSTEDAVIHKLEGGDRSSAMKRLRVQPMTEVQSAWTTFRLGLYVGCFLVMAVLIAVTVAVDRIMEFRPREPRWVGVRLFRGFFLLLFNIWLMGLNVYVFGTIIYFPNLLFYFRCGWQGAGVNHVLIFDINPRDHLTYQGLMELVSFFCVVWGVCVLGYLYGYVISLPPLLFPLIFATFMVLWLFWPFEWPKSMSKKSARKWLLSHLFTCCTAPFQHVTFPDFWLGDQMNSLVTFFLDVDYFICFYATEVVYGASQNGTQWIDVIEANAPSAIANETANNPVLELLNITNSLANYTEPVSENPLLVVGQEVNGVIFATGFDQCSGGHRIIRPIISLIPALVRFLQCLRRFWDSGFKDFHPHLSNAGKYSTAFLVIITGTLKTYHGKSSEVVTLENPLFYAWVVAYVLSYGYTLSWDLFMDWSLMKKEHGFLRAELAYSKKWYYYMAMCMDALLRLSWVLNVSLGVAWTIEADIMLCITGPLECCRRFMWNYFRLENEHLNNCGKFRAVRDISLKPIRSGELEKAIEKMDQEDGVDHRRHDHIGTARKRKSADRVKKVATIPVALSRRITTALRNYKSEQQSRNKSQAAVYPIADRNCDKFES